MMYLDVDAALKGIQDTMIQVLEQASQDYMEMLREFWNGGLPGKTSWQNDLKKDLKIIERYRGITLLENKIGFSYSMDDFTSFKKMRAMVINYGSGSRGLTGIAIHTKPGESVWNNDLSGMQTSTATVEYLLPDGFNQAGLNAFEESFLKFEPEFIARVSEAFNNFDWNKYITVKR